MEFLASVKARHLQYSWDSGDSRDAKDSKQSMDFKKVQGPYGLLSDSRDS